MPIPIFERSEKEMVGLIRKKVLGIEKQVVLASELSFEHTHQIALEIEEEIKKDIPGARITIHTEPAGAGRESVWKLVKQTSEDVPGSRGVHNIHIQSIEGKLCVDLHLEVSANMTVKQAHDVAEEIEKRLRIANPEFAEITIHLESASESIHRESTGIETELEPYIEAVAKSFPQIKRVHGIRITRTREGLHVVLQCHFDPDVTMKEVHEISSKLEALLRIANPRITRIDVHEEPESEP